MLYLSVCPVCSVPSVVWCRRPENPDSGTLDLEPALTEMRLQLLAGPHLQLLLFS